MALTHLTLEQITQADLQHLIDSASPESQLIEYKRQTYGNSDDQRAEFLADISSFANSLGGDLIIGMGAENGIPTTINALTEADSEILRLESMAITSLQPRVSGLKGRAIPISKGGSVIIFRIPKSYNPPHRVIFKNKNRFWARSSAGKYEPNIDELRDLFLKAPYLAENIRNFKFDRISKIAAQNAQTPLAGKKLLILHLIPYSAFSGNFMLPIETIKMNQRHFPPMSRSQANNYRVNFDGFLTLSNPYQKSNEQRAYTQIYRTGIVESLQVLNTENGVNISNINYTIDQQVNFCLSGLKACGIIPPIAIMVSIIGCKDLGSFIADSNNSYREPAEPIDREQLHFSEIILNGYPENLTATTQLLEQFHEQLHNTVGISN